jgi:hypothetical protein
MLLQRIHKPWATWGVFLLLCLAGCSRPTGDVSGTIKIAGKAPNLQGLEIAFVADDGAEATAPINLDGSFAAKNVPTGEVRVGFMGGYPKGSTKSRRSGKDPDGQPAVPRIDLSQHPIPECLRAPSTSDVKFTVEAGKVNPFNYDITPPE